MTVNYSLRVNFGITETTDAHFLAAYQWFFEDEAKRRFLPALRRQTPRVSGELADSFGITSKPAQVFLAAADKAPYVEFSVKSRNSLTGDAHDVATLAGNAFTDEVSDVANTAYGRFRDYLIQQAKG